MHKSVSIQQDIFQKYMKRALKIKQRKKQVVKYHVGQTVRVQYSKNKMTRSYNEQAGSQRYIIRSIDSKSRLYPLYYLENERGVLLRGGAFLQSQLVPIDLTDEYRGRRLKTFKKGKQKYAKITFKGYSSDWDEDVKL